MADERDQQKKEEQEVESHGRGHHRNETVDPESPSMDAVSDREDEEEVQAHHRGHH